MREHSKPSAPVVATAESGARRGAGAPPRRAGSRRARSRRARLSLVLATAVLAAGAGVLVAAPPAAADWDDTSCWAPKSSTCTTRAIPAHRSEYWVRVKTPASFAWWVTDLDTGVIVGHDIGTGGGWRKINGLYGERYQLKLSNLSGGGGRGRIANCTSGCRND